MIVPTRSRGPRAGALRQPFLCLEGELDIHADDGETRCFRPGSTLIVGVAPGQENPSRVMGPADARVAVGQLSG